MELSCTDFTYVQGLVREGSAIVLEAGKEYLVQSRLAPLARSEGCPSIAELLNRVRGAAGERLSLKVVEAMTTNETSFFRDFIAFEGLRTAVLPALMAARATTRELRIWCAACSTGQEPYSLAMQLSDGIPELASWRVRLLGTDLCEDVLARARAGAYTQLEVNRGLPAKQLVKHFVKQGARWELKPEIRAMVEFQRANLARPFLHLGTFDLVLLRNVMIYFSRESRQDVLARVRTQLRPDGYLLLGGSETTLGLDVHWRRESMGQSWCYRPKP